MLKKSSTSNFLFPILKYLYKYNLLLLFQYRILILFFCDFCLLFIFILPNIFRWLTGRKGKEQAALWWNGSNIAWYPKYVKKKHNLTPCVHFFKFPKSTFHTRNTLGLGNWERRKKELISFRGWTIVIYI